MTTAALPAHLTTPGADVDLLRRELLAIITGAIINHPRSQQVAIGPSEIGHPCARRIGFKLLGMEDPAEEDPNWKATVGTAIHAWLEEVFAADSARHYAPQYVTRWLLEETVTVGEVCGEPIGGHCDLYDLVTFTVVDWKSVGPTQLKKYKAHGPGDQYRAQAHLYGRGWQLAGRQVENVAVMFLPRNGELREAHFWAEPYDERIALAALARLEGIKRTVDALATKALPLLPTADAYCTLCPHYRRGATDLTQACPGDPAAIPARSQDRVLDLI